MDTELKKTNESQASSDVQDRPEIQASRQSDENLDPEKALELEMLMSEYQTDRDAILLTIQNALKTQDYEEAQAFVYKYRVAAKHDENFELLARMTAQGLESAKKIEKVVTVLEATAEEDYETRMALCERILKIQPDNVKYKAELERCRSAAGLDSPKKKTGDVQKVSQKLVIGMVGFFIVLIILVCALFF